MMFRVVSMFMVFPVYGFSGIPRMVKLGLALLLTSLLFPLYSGPMPELAPGLISFFGIVIREVFVGLAIGMVGNFLFYGAQFAGHVIGHTAGFAMISVLDPLAEINVPIIAQLLNYLTLLLFLIIGGHHFLLFAVDESFIRIPVGGGVFAPGMTEGMMRMTADIFVVGVKLGAPVLVTILVIEFSLGVIARTVPQMNVWLVGFPLKIGLSIMVLAISLPLLAMMFEKFFADWQGILIDYIYAAAGD